MHVSVSTHMHMYIRIGACGLHNMCVYLRKITVVLFWILNGEKLVFQKATESGGGRHTVIEKHAFSIKD